MVVVRDGVNMSSKTSDGDSGTGMVGLIGDVKSLIVTEFSMDNYSGGGVEGCEEAPEVAG